ncbi:hypothetical protein KQX54_015639 [Cotesia glomerata]|uniref:Uncharacterized protein n=1 Tax=Cotesia glomerata TaxID=32391 RepID=A0AAV7HYX9_COTGL|nr:hypothetical protein KQX54_015639 [Cotesia glomerata]
MTAKFEVPHPPYLTSCCGVGVEDANPQEPVSPGAVGVAGGVSVIPERPPLELDKLPPYHDVTPTPGHNVWSWLGSRRGGGAAGVVATPLSLPPHRCAMNLPVENHYTHMQTDEALYAELDSQTASYASDLQLQLRGSSTYGGRATTPGDEEEDEYHELDAARLHRRYSGDSQTGTLKERRHNQRLQEPDYEMYENGPSTPLSLSRHQHPSHQHHHHHHHHLRTGAGSEVNPSYQNTAYTGSDADLDGPFLSSAPSSAYYSDLSSNSANNHQQSSGVTLHTNASSMQTQTQTGTCHQANTTTESPYRLAAITETTTPSDYI